MIDHLSTYATDFAKTKAFYDATLATLGYGLVTEMVATWNPEWPTQRLAAYGTAGKPQLWLIERKTPLGGGHVAFKAPDRASVHAWHAAAVANGGTDDGAPGPREMYSPTYYAAFAIDPDGNHLEVVTHGS